MESSDLISDKEPSPRAGLACERCRRRKIKCDRVLPACRTCFKTSRTCSYPSTSRKPGPKPGAPQRRRPRHGLATSRPNGVSSSNAFLENCVQSPRYHDQDVPPPSTPGHARRTDLEGTPTRGLALSQLVHPSHEPTQNHLVESPSQGQNIGRRRDYVISEVCNDLNISASVYRYLLDYYFENMTAFSLFHRPSFEKKIMIISSPLQIQALVAAVFSFSARFRDTHLGNLNIPSRVHFRKIAEQAVEEALDKCSDDTPPLCLLQALILITFDELSSGVRGRAWRLVGKCVRVAYELQLHLVDKDPPNRDTSTDLLAEENRRAWWAIWEFDVFASTIRRLPTAIDWGLNATWLPIEDDVWFANSHSRSCHLDLDAASAWKSLQKSGNQSPKAWFIVVNALMRSAHVLSYPQAYPNTLRGQRPGSAEDVQGGLDILSNALYCLSAALPPRLAYHGEYLVFSKTSGGEESLQLDSAKHSIHVMTQLSRFMINHYQVFDSTSRQLSLVNNVSKQAIPAVNQSPWNHYLAAASEIVTLVRSCSPRHVNHVCPFLSCTIWLAAAAQVVSKHIGTPVIDRRVAESNLDLLQTNLNAYVSTWGVSNALPQKLVTLESRLNSFGEHVIGTMLRDSRQGEQASESMHLATGEEGRHHSETRRNGANLTSSNRPSQPIGPSTNDWSFQQELGVAGPEFGQGLGVDLWGWGLDELLSYNGMNELSTY